MALNNEREKWPGDLAAPANDVPNVEHENHVTESFRINNEAVIVKEVKLAVKEMVANGLSTTV